MAMNKKEQLAFDALKEELAIVRALRWTEPVAPDLAPPKDYKELVKGFLFNTYAQRVSPACTDSLYHSDGQDDRTTTQNPRRLYSTRAFALKAMRYETEMECAKKLAKLDALIAEQNDL